MRLLPLSAALIAPALLSAATLNYTSNCQLETYGTSTGFQACSNNPTGTSTPYFGSGVPFSIASTSAPVVSVGNTLAIQATGNASGIGPSIPDRAAKGLYTATSSGTYSTPLYTTGPERQGYMTVALNYLQSSAAESPDYASANVNLAGLVDPANTAASNIGCGVRYLTDGCQSEVSLINYFNQNKLFTIDLGKSFTLNLTTLITSSGGGPQSDNDFGIARLNMAFQFSLFEADGTPVDILSGDQSTAPEPSTFAAMGLGLLALSGAWRRNLRAKG